MTAETLKRANEIVAELKKLRHLINNVIQTERICFKSGFEEEEFTPRMDRFYKVFNGAQALAENIIREEIQALETEFENL